MAEVYTKTDIARQLEQKQSDINSHLDDLKSGVESVGRDVVEEMRKRPVIYAIGGLAIGLLIGILVRAGRKKHRKVTDAYADLIDKYLDDVVDEAARHVKKGASADEAIARVVRDRGPIFVYAPDSRKQKKEGSSVIKDLFLAVAMPLVQAGVARATAMMGGDGEEEGGK